MHNPAIAGGELVGKWFYTALQNVATRHGLLPAVPWDRLADPERARYAEAGAEVVSLMREAGLLDRAKAQIDPGLAKVLPKQRAN